MKKTIALCAAWTGAVGACVFGLASMATLLYAAPAAALDEPGVKVTAISPSSGALVSGTTTFRASVTGALPGDYNMYWSVDNGKWNPMSADPLSPNTNESTIDLSGWKWHADNTYTITFIAFMKRDWRTVQASTVLHVVPDTSKKQELPLADKLFLNPHGQVLQAAQGWAAAHPTDAPLMNKLASQPMVEWYGNWNNDVHHDVDNYVTAATAAGTLPAFVTYNIPQRDCGGWSAGGANGQDSYRQWIQAVTDGIGNRRALVIVEPDALAGMDCLNDADKQTRLQLLRYTVHLLHSQTQASVYLDAGNAHWQTADAMAKRLKQADIDEATGFALNVSNFIKTKDSTAYGINVSKQISNKHFVIDTSRNGNGPTNDYQWCNPDGRAIGELPTTQTGQDFVDAFLWVKGPGGSDGSCGASIDGTWAPSAGQWWPQYALSLMRNAGW